MKSIRSFRLLLLSRRLATGLALSAVTISEVDAVELTVNTVSDTHDATPGDGQCADTQGKCSFRAAIEEISKAPLPRVINLPAGTYNLILGELEITVSMGILGAGSKLSIIDGNHQSRIFYLRNISQTGYEPTVNLGGATIRNGKAPNSTSPGGGIRVGPGSTLGLYDCVVSGSESVVSGAGIANEGYLSMESCAIKDNKITGLTTGGGVTATGGGIFNAGYAPPTYPLPGFVEIISCTISGNQATRGGGIDNWGTLRIQNSTISGNKVFAGGGGIKNVGVAWIAFSTITNNVANLGARDEDPNRTTGGGIYNLGTISMGSTILAGNTDNRDKSNTLYSPDCYSRTDANNAVFKSEGGNVNGIINGNCNLDLGYGGQAGTQDKPLDPGLDPLLDNGGLTMTHALRFLSPAIDQGTSIGYFFDCPAADQRGETRPKGQGCDAGAFESVYTYRIVIVQIVFLLLIALFIITFVKASGLSSFGNKPRARAGRDIDNGP